MRTARVHGACLAGAVAELVVVEGRFDPAREGSRTEVRLTGLPDPVLREARTRLLVALGAVGLGPGPGELHLNLVPAARPKRGGSLDLAMALAAAAASGHLSPGEVGRALYLGELGLDGVLHAVPGGLAAADAARARGLRVIVAPPATAREAACLPEVEAYEAFDLPAAVAHAVGGPGAAMRAAPPPTPPPPEPGARLAALAAVRGHAAAKRALAVAAAGGHALLLAGPPGTGKSLLARALPGLLPLPSLRERVEITRALSAAGLWPRGLALERPFRAPHHTTSYAGLVGGGAPPAPGEVSLAHRGVLFLDELPEFRREALEALRQPLEEGRARVTRAAGRLELPARFQLVAAMNPCPCGYRGHPRIPCRCSPHAVSTYRRRISGPLLDRVDLRVEVPAPSVDELTPARRRSAPDDDARALLASIEAAVERRRARQGEALNASLDADDLDEVAPLRRGSRALVEAAAEARGLSARAVQSLRRVARTVADLDGVATPGERQLAEALGLRAEP